MTQLSPHFSLKELTTTATGLSNEPTPPALARLTLLASRLEEVREVVGCPLRVNSGYRSLSVNRAVRGSTSSAHCSGDAADLVAIGVPGELAMERIAAARAAGRLAWLDQAILYAGGMIHVGQARADRKPRGELLRSLARSGAGGPYEFYL
jgi:putative chitinase